jgi:hypothetical protein
MVGQQIEKELQQLDPHGCSGHLSFILDLLVQEGFRQGYLRGNWELEDFRNTIASYELVPHNFTTQEQRLVSLGNNPGRRSGRE